MMTLNSFVSRKMILALVLVVSLLGSVASECFLADMKPPYVTGLKLSGERETQCEDRRPCRLVNSKVESPGNDSNVASEDEIETLNDWKAQFAQYAESMLRGETSIEEWIECHSDSVTFDLADGPGTALNVDQFTLLFNTYIELVTNYTHGYSTVEIIDHHTLEFHYIRTTRARLGFMRKALPWVTAMSNVDDQSGEIEFNSWETFQWRMDDEGKIMKATLIAPKFQRQILGALLSVYMTTYGPIGREGEAGPSQTLTIFGYNAFVMMLIALISVITMLIGTCLLLFMRMSKHCVPQTVAYNKVEIVSE